MKVVPNYERLLCLNMRDVQESDGSPLDISAQVGNVWDMQLLGKWSVSIS